MHFQNQTESGVPLSSYYARSHTFACMVNIMPWQWNWLGLLWRWAVANAVLVLVSYEIAPPKFSWGKKACAINTNSLSVTIFTLNCSWGRPKMGVFNGRWQKKLNTFTVKCHIDGTDSAAAVTIGVGQVRESFGRGQINRSRTTGNLLYVEMRTKSA